MTGTSVTCNEFMLMKFDGTRVNIIWLVSYASAVLVPDPTNSILNLFFSG